MAESIKKIPLWTDEIKEARNIQDKVEKIKCKIDEEKEVLRVMTEEFKAKRSEKKKVLDEMTAELNALKENEAFRTHDQIKLVEKNLNDVVC